MASKMKPAFSKFPSLRLLCSHCRQRLLPPYQQKRLLTTQPPQNPVNSRQQELLSNLNELSNPSPNTNFKDAANSALNKLTSRLSTSSGQYTPIKSSGSTSSPGTSSVFSSIKNFSPDPPPHRLHVYSTKHNCHITLSNGKRQPLISVAAGNIGFRKAARGTYDAAYQLGAYVMGRIQQQGLLKDIHALELILRDYGPGREAFTKILMGNEGRAIRGTVVRVMDATRLKFGGTRSKKPRRLG